MGLGLFQPTSRPVACSLFKVNVRLTFPSLGLTASSPAAGSSDAVKRFLHTSCFSLLRMQTLRILEEWEGWGRRSKAMSEAIVKKPLFGVCHLVFGETRWSVGAAGRGSRRTLFYFDAFIHSFIFFEDGDSTRKTFFHLHALF